ncbi:phosphopantetheine-binding protein [Streptomyces sp. NPDC051940]|uniref:phosphopantetheine-binding protein n=1 Tax=Streptomyces sp. NPDC051940 TaxID=3155675 RepID=UPI00341FBCB0
MRVDSLHGFMALVRDELGVALSIPQDAHAELADLPGWDSLNLLRLVVLLEERGHPVAVHQLLLARDLNDMFTLVKGR